MAAGTLGKLCPGKYSGGGMGGVYLGLLELEGTPLA